MFDNDTTTRRPAASAREWRVDAVMRILHFYPFKIILSIYHVKS
jgi:hypothetical protein